MPNFENFVAGHGELGVQALVGRIEPYGGIQSTYGALLEERWKAVMEARSVVDRRMAAWP